MRRHLAALVALSVIHALSLLAVGAEAYRIEEISLPETMSPEASAVAFAPSGRMFVANRHGDVWSCESSTRRWQRYAHGLHEALGLVAVSDTEIYAAHKPELTRLLDTDGDGTADDYQTVTHDWASTDNWHEHVFGLRRDGDGSFVLALGLADTAGPINVLWPRVPLDFSRLAREQKLSLGKHQGWVIKVAPGGEIVPWASGFREPCGVGISPAGDVFITDQQGDYIPSSALIHVEQGKFYGHPASAKWDRQFAGQQPSIEDLARLRVPPSVYLPHGSMGGSPGEPVWDQTQGRFGPFAGQVFVGDFTKLISRIDLEKVGGQWQGACFTFLRDAVGTKALAANSGANNLVAPAGGEGLKYFQDVAPLSGTPLRQGSMRMAFAADGSLYVAQTTRGWGPGDGMQRIVWTGQTPFEIRTMRLTDRGFRLNFTAPLDRGSAGEATRYLLNRFRYVYHENYGSPRVDPLELKTTAVRLVGEDTVDIDVEPLEPGYIYEVNLDGVLASDGRHVGYPQAFYTLNRTLDGRRYEGSITAGNLKPAKVEPPRPADPKLGKRVYATFCVQCHRTDGKGGGLPGVGAADFTRPGGVLAKTDQELTTRIAQGIPGKTMPPFGYVLSEQQIADVLAFVRASYHSEPTSSTETSSPAKEPR
jgi:mono/diheme cytochrome c family protein/glucose/arabinose dehydrogenase